jgi:hypothetical protein
MKYAVEIGLGAVIHIPSFTKIGSAVEKSIRGIHKHTDRQTYRYTHTEAVWRPQKSTFIFRK